MALKQNKDGMAAAIAAAAAQTSAAGRAHHALPRGTVGAVRAGVSGIQEISPEDILAWGPQDRLGIELTAVNSHEAVQELAESIKINGQQVPVLLRPSREQDGKFEVVYGRRRILACRIVGVAVKALVRTMDDGQALIAKGLENSSREDLSFYERARFAKAIAEQGYSNDELMQALAISKNTLSQLNRVTKHIPDDIGDLIGPAPKSGRAKWETISDAFRDGRILEDDFREMLVDLPQVWESDERMEVALNYIRGKFLNDPKPKVKHITNGISLKSDKRGITISVKRTGRSAEFADWLEKNIEELVKRAHDEAG